MEQWPHKSERGTNFYIASKELKNNWTLNYEIEAIKNVGHDYKRMPKNAVECLKTNLKKWIFHLNLFVLN